MWSICVVGHVGLLLTFNGAPGFTTSDLRTWNARGLRRSFLIVHYALPLPRAEGGGQQQQHPLLEALSEPAGPHAWPQ
jgi:hypothetical protein